MPLLRILLLPFAFLYKLITDIRNHLYDTGKKKSIQFDKYVISVGNLTVGGTGKTPFVELLIRLMKKEYRLAILSRGYGRNTKGFRQVNEHDHAGTVGDEPFQYFTKYGREITVAVGEKRAMAISKIIENDNNIEVVILDDAYQHRSVKRDLNILLNDYNRPFYHDFVMPSGLLREYRIHAKRADCVVVTKCPPSLKKDEMLLIRENIQKYSGIGKEVFFTGINYLKPLKLFGDEDFSGNVVLFSGIANSKPLEKYVDDHFNLLANKQFPDHYSFTERDLKKLVHSFNQIEEPNKCFLTTEKDMVRLLSMGQRARFLREYAVFYLPIELYFLENGDFFANYLNRKMHTGTKKIEQK